MKKITLTLTKILLLALLMTGTMMAAVARPKPVKQRDKLRWGYSYVYLNYQCVDGQLVLTGIQCSGAGDDKCKAPQSSIVSELDYETTDMSTAEWELVDYLFDYSEEQLENDVDNGSHTEYITITDALNVNHIYAYTINWSTAVTEEVTEEITITELL